jgi:hypothetical protein
MQTRMTATMNSAFHFRLGFMIKRSGTWPGGGEN